MKRERIAKIIARAGLCSRREAERRIEEGRVVVDGNIINSPAFNVSDGNEILVDGIKLMAPSQSKLWLYHKPKGLITTHNDPRGRKTVFDSLPADIPRVISVGRLDINTEGLLLMTNNGEMARYMESPETGWQRVYRVRVYGHIKDSDLAYLKSGLTIKDKESGQYIKYGKIEASLYQQVRGKNFWLRIAINEGKNREVRRICNHLGLAVNRLIRTDYGPFELGSLKSGEIRKISQEKLNNVIPADIGIL